jgi:hypothetical protein
VSASAKWLTDLPALSDTIFFLLYPGMSRTRRRSQNESLRNVKVELKTLTSIMTQKGNSFLSILSCC